MTGVQPDVTVEGLLVLRYSPIPSGGGPSGKAPLVAWREYQQRRPTHAEVLIWIEELHPKLWGIVTGAVSGLVVADCDSGEAKALMGDLEPHVRTPRGGAHFYFQHPGHPVKTVASLLPGLDVRGDGGFCNILGAGYTILRLPTPETVYPWEKLPEKVRRALEAPSSPAYSSAGGTIPTGDRNQRLTRMAGGLRRQGATQAVIEIALLAANARQCDPPLSGREVRGIASSIAGYVAGERNNLTSDYKEERSEVRLLAIPAALLRERGTATDRPPLRFLPVIGQERIIVASWSHLISGYPKSGKTELITQVAARWCAQRVRVRFYSEEPEGVWEARLAKLPSIDGLDVVFALGVDADVILADMQAAQADVVIVDTIRLLRLEDENSNSEINRVLTPFIAAARQRGQTLVLLHHTRKGAGDHGIAAAGGHAFLGVVDVALELARAGDAPRRRVIRGWGRVVEVPTLAYEMGDDGVMKALGDPRELALEEVKDRLLSSMTSDWTTTKAVRDALDDPKPSGDQVAKALATLAGEGLMERDPPLSAGPQQGKQYKWRLRNLTSDGPSLRAEVRLGPTDCRADDVLRV